MSKQFVDELIHHMKLAGIITKATPWMIEGLKEGEMNVRYVGIKIADDWLEVLSNKDNLLLKFVIDRTSAKLEFYLANIPPFIKFASRQFTDQDKWEVILGEVKRRLKKDKKDFTNHRETVGNLYSRIKPQK